MQIDATQSPSVSVVIPTYNRANLVSEAVQSVLAQSYRATEIIVVDDGSSDGTAAALHWCRDQIRYVYQANAGVAAARNTGMRLATGNWLAFLDSDDQWLPDKLAVQMRQLAAYPQAICHVCNMWVELAAGAPIDLFELCRNRAQLARNPLLLQPLTTVLRGNCFVQATMVRRDVVQQLGGFRCEMPLYEDLEWLTRLAQLGPWVTSVTPLVRLRRDPADQACLTGIRRREPVRCRIRYIKILRRLLASNHIGFRERLFIRHRLSAYLYELAEWFFQHQRPARARPLLAASVLYGNLKSWVRALPPLLSAGRITRWPRPWPRRRHLSRA